MIKTYDTNKIPVGCDVLTMRYSQYKKHYSDCGVVDGSYDKFDKTIDVVIPKGRMKKSGVRNKTFSRYLIKCSDAMKSEDEGHDDYYFVATAVSKENAIKQAKKAERKPLKVIAISNGRGNYGGWIYYNAADKANQEMIDWYCECERTKWENPILAMRDAGMIKPEEVIANPTKVKAKFEVGKAYRISYAARTSIKYVKVVDRKEHEVIFETLDGQRESGKVYHQEVWYNKGMYAEAIAPTVYFDLTDDYHSGGHVSAIHVVSEDEFEEKRMTIVPQNLATAKEVIAEIDAKIDATNAREAIGGEVIVKELTKRKAKYLDRITRMEKFLSLREESSKMAKTISRADVNYFVGGIEKAIEENRDYVSEEVQDKAVESFGHKLPKLGWHARKDANAYFEIWLFGEGFTVTEEDGEVTESKIQSEMELEAQLLATEEKSGLKVELADALYPMPKGSDFEVSFQEEIICGKDEEIVYGLVPVYRIRTSDYEIKGLDNLKKFNAQVEQAIKLGEKLESLNLIYRKNINSWRALTKPSGLILENSDEKVIAKYVELANAEIVKYEDAIVRIQKDIPEIQKILEELQSSSKKGNKIQRQIKEYEAEISMQTERLQDYTEIVATLREEVRKSEKVLSELRFGLKPPDKTEKAETVNSKLIDCLGLYFVNTDIAAEVEIENTQNYAEIVDELIEDSFDTKMKLIPYETQIEEQQRTMKLLDQQFTSQLARNAGLRRLMTTAEKISKCLKEVWRCEVHIAEHKAVLTDIESKLTKLGVKPEEFHTELTVSDKSSKFDEIKAKVEEQRENRKSHIDWSALDEDNAESSKAA